MKGGFKHGQSDMTLGELVEFCQMNDLELVLDADSKTVGYRSADENGVEWVKYA